MSGTVIFPGGGRLSLEAHMTVASWSRTRILTLWAVGITLQAVLMVGPVLLARHVVANSAAFLRAGVERDARWQTAERADSLSLAKQRADARATGSYSIAPNGDTLFAVVRVPSGRPDSAVVAASIQRLQRIARYASAVILGFIPTVLVVLTLSWVIARRRSPRVA